MILCCLVRKSRSNRVSHATLFLFRHVLLSELTEGLEPLFFGTQIKQTYPGTSDHTCPRPHPIALQSITVARPLNSALQPIIHGNTGTESMLFVVFYCTLLKLRTTPYLISSTVHSALMDICCRKNSGSRPGSDKRFSHCIFNELKPHNISLCVRPSVVVTMTSTKCLIWGQNCSYIQTRIAGTQRRSW